MMIFGTSTQLGKTPDVKLSVNCLQLEQVISCKYRKIVVEKGQADHLPCDFFLSFVIVCFTSYFVFSIAVLPHSPGVVYYHLLLRRETRFPRVAPFSFRRGIWDLFVHRGQKSRSMMHFTCLIPNCDPGMRLSSLTLQVIAGPVGSWCWVSAHTGK